MKGWEQSNSRTFWIASPRISFWICYWFMKNRPLQIRTISLSLGSQEGIQNTFSVPFRRCALEAKSSLRIVLKRTASPTGGIFRVRNYRNNFWRHTCWLHADGSTANKSEKYENIIIIAGYYFDTLVLYWEFDCVKVAFKRRNVLEVHVSTALFSKYSRVSV